MFFVFLLFFLLFVNRLSINSILFAISRKALSLYTLNVRNERIFVRINDYRYGESQITMNMCNISQSKFRSCATFVARVIMQRVIRTVRRLCKIT